MNRFIIFDGKMELQWGPASEARSGSVRTWTGRTLRRLLQWGPASEARSGTRRKVAVGILQIQLQWGPASEARSGRAAQGAHHDRHHASMGPGL